MYTTLSPISRNQWHVSEPVKTATPIATVTRHENGQCSATIMADALNREELSSLSAFMDGLEH
jgi:hypothetical protein